MVIEKMKEVRHLKFQIKILDEKIEEIRGQMELQAAKYSDMPKAEGYTNSVIQVLTDKILELESKKDKLQTKIDFILEELSELPETIYKVAYYRQVNNMSWLEIANKVNYSVAQCHRFYDHAKNNVVV